MKKNLEILILVIVISVITDMRASESISDTIRFDYNHNKIFIPVYIDGIKKIFLFDTGFSQTAIDKLGKIATDKKILRDANGIEMKFDCGSVDSIRLGKFQFKNKDVLLYDFDQAFIKCYDLDGVIGGDLLKDFIVKLDWKNSYLIISTTDKVFRDEMKKNNSIPMKLFNNNPFLILDKGKKNKEYILFDTGDPSLYTLSLKNFIKYNKDISPFVIDSIWAVKGAGTSGYPTDTVFYALELPQKKIGNVMFQNMLVHTTPNKVSRIGSKLLNYGNVIIDYRKNQFYFIPYGEKTSVTVKEPLHVYLKFTDAKALLSCVWPTSEEYKAGLRNGQIVKEINGIKMNGEQSVCDFRSEIRKNTITIVVIDNKGDERKYVIKRQ